MPTDEVIKRILALKPNLTREAIQKMVDDERAKAAGLLTEEAAAHLVASNLGINGAGERIEARLKIGDLTPNLSDVSLTGRVVHVFPSRTFDRDSQRKGKVLRMILGDRSGTVTVVFWDEKAAQVEASKLEPGTMVRLLHGYSRERRGSVEVNVGNRGQLILNPLDAYDGDYPKLDEFFQTPADVFKEGTIHIQGVVVGSFPPSTFKRQDGSDGRVGRIVLEEGGARVNLVLWDERVDEMGGLEPGTRVRIVSGNARTGNQGSPEVHVGWDTQIIVLAHGVKPKEPVPHWTKIGDLREGMGSVNVAALATQIGEAREFVRRDGSDGRVVSVLLEDDTGAVRLNLWDDDAELAKKMGAGSVVVVENGYTRAGLQGIELNAGRNGRVHVDPEDLGVELPKLERKITQIAELREGQKNVTVQGQLLDDPVQRDIDTARGPATVTNFRVDDGTGEARVSLWREHAEKAMDLTAGSQVQLEYMNVREPFDGLIQLSSSAFTRITIVRK